MKLKRITTIIAVAGIGVAGVLWAALRSPSREPRDLPTLTVRRSDLIESTVAVGTLQAQVGAEVKVGSRLSGVLRELHVGVGERVDRGAVLARLDDADWRARLAMAQAGLAAAGAERDFAASELARAEGLRDLVPAAQVESARRTLRVRTAEVERFEAALAEAEVNLGYTLIRAPVAGTIASIATYVGETVAASLAAPTFLTLVDLTRLEVRAFVDETDIGKVVVGQVATVRVDAFPGRQLAARVRAVDPKAELVQNVVNYVVTLDLTDRGEGAEALVLRPDMTVHVDFVLDQRSDVVTLPRAAVFRREGRDFVRLLGVDGWSERGVTLGLATPQRVEITAGLEAGDIVLADRQAWLPEEESR